MDTSETYIKMCERAEEIQAHCGKDQIGNESHSYTRGKIFLGCGVLGLELADSNYKSDEVIWLPHQDQLQEMIGDESSYPVSHLLLRINEFYSKLNYWGNDAGDITMEQLWLAFMMKEKCGKVWTGEAWEAIKAGVK